MADSIFSIQLMNKMKNGKLQRHRDKTQVRLTSIRRKCARTERCSCLAALESSVTYKILFIASTYSPILGRLKFRPLINSLILELATLAS
jgi:hypothetical protein